MLAFISHVDETKSDKESTRAESQVDRRSRRNQIGAFFEWDQTFAFVRDPDTDSPGPTLEVSVWDMLLVAAEPFADDDRHGKEASPSARPASRSPLSSGASTTGR